MKRLCLCLGLVAGLELAGADDPGADVPWQMLPADGTNRPPTSVEVSALGADLDAFVGIAREANAAVAVLDPRTRTWGVSDDIDIDSWPGYPSVIIVR